MDKRFWGFLVVVAVILGAVFFVGNTKKAEAPAGGSSKGVLTNHVTGTGTSGVTLTEYGDYQCPACGQYYQPVKEVVTKYGDVITFQFRNFPLYQIHPNAIAGARAAEAAGKQNKYWQMHDMLYENQSAWTGVSNPQTAFEAYAKSLNLNVAKFQTDFKSTAVNDFIQADLAEGNRLKVNSTPTFFLDGKKISNPTSVDGFTKVIDAEIAKKAATNKTSPPAATVPSTDSTGTNTQ